MLRWSVIFFIVALVAGFFGFTGVSSAATDIAKTLFYIFLVVWAVLLVAALAVGGRIRSKL
jgi:uncharacterized membrane protein YtjA (UPF0391 family)